MAGDAIVAAASAAAGFAGKLAMQHPMAATCIGTGIAFVAAPAVITAPILATVGFGTGGVVAGSTAACVQSGIGSVVAPSLFATLTSAGAGGYGVAVVNGAAQGFGVAVAAMPAVGALLKR